MTAKVFATITAASLVLWAVILAAVGFVPWSALGFLGAVALAVLVLVGVLWLGFSDQRHHGKLYLVSLLVLVAGSPALAQSTLELAPQTSAPQQGLLLTLFIQYLLPILMTGLSALLTWGMKLGVDWLKTKGETSKAMLAVATLAEGARSAVANAEATIKADLVEASKDGVITKEEGARIKAHVLEELKKMPAPVLKAAAGLFGGNIETYLGGLVERTLAAQKATLPSSPPAEAPAPVVALPAPAVTAPGSP